MKDNKVKLQDLFNELGLSLFLEVLWIIFGCIFTYYLIKVILPRLAEAFPPRFRILLLNFIPVSRLVLSILGTLWVAFLIFNINLQNIVLVFSTIGVALGFALKDFVTSAFAGVVAIFERPYRMGDWVTIGDNYGEVVKIGIRSIQLDTPNGNIVTIPHSRIWTDNVINGNDGVNTLMCIAKFYIDPREQANEVRQLLCDVAKTSPYLSWQQPIEVILSNQPYATEVLLKAFPFDLRDQLDFISDITERGRNTLIEAGIQIVEFRKIKRK